VGAHNVCDLSATGIPTMASANICTFMNKSRAAGVISAERLIAVACVCPSRWLKSTAVYMY
jgi:hypothetical protein